MYGKEIKAWIFEEMHKTNCPQCNSSLKTRWISDEEKNKLTFDVSDPRFIPELKNGSELTQVEYAFCSNCNWQKPTLIVRDIYKDISLPVEKKYLKEKALIEKITDALLPNHSLKVRFIVSREYNGLTLTLYIRRTYAVCFNVKNLLELEKETPGAFIDVVAHELAHAEVLENPQYDFKNPYYCSCKTKKGVLERVHKGEGHDKIWHDKYDEFRERIKNERLAEGSGYLTLGKDFVRSKFRDGNSDKPSFSPTNLSDKGNKAIWWIGGGVLFIFIFLLLIFLVRKRKKIS